MILLLALLCLSAAARSAHAQTPAATAPAPATAAATPKTIKAVLTKAGQFTKFLQLLQSTQEDSQIDNQLKGKSSSGGLTVFAPPDNAFSALKSGTLNALSDAQKTSLVQFHVVSQLIPMAQFDTASNPLRTQAGETRPGKYPLNVTADGQQVNISTGVVNASVSGTVYTGDRLVVYQVDKVLLPWALYGPALPPAPAPSPVEKEKEKGKVGPKAAADAPAADAATASEAAVPARPGGVWGQGGVFGVAVAVAAAWFVV